MVELGATNGAASSDALRGRRSFATRPVQPVEVVDADGIKWVIA
jgi:hypothetical protein